MSARGMTEEQLIKELQELRSRVAELERNAAGHQALWKTLEQSQQQLQLILDSAWEGVFGLDLDGNHTLVNPAAAKMLGYEVEELLGRPSHSTWHHSKPDGSPYPVEECPIHAILKEGTSHHVRNEVFWRQDGTSFPVAYSGTPLKENGRIVGAVVTFWDRSERQRAEEALRQSEELYRSLFENMLNGFAYCKMLFEQNQPQDFIYLKVNSSFEVLTGLQNVVGKRVSEVIPGLRESAPELFEIYGRVALTGKPERFETYVEALKMWFSISVYSPEKEYFVVIFDVITARKEAEEELKRSARFISDIISHAREGIIVYDRQLNLLVWNRFMEELTALSAEAVLGKNALGLFPHLKKHGVDVLLKRALQGESVRSGDVNFKIPRTKREGWVSASYGPYYDADGNILGVIGIVNDITARKEAEREIQRLASFPQLNPNPVLEVDFSGSITFANQAALATIERLVPPARLTDLLPQDLREILARARKKPPKQFYREVKVRNAVFATSIHCPESLRVVRFYLTDITARHQAEEELRRALEEATRSRRETSTLLEATRAILENHPFETTAKSIFNCCISLIGASSGSVALLSADGSEGEVLFLESGGLSYTVASNLPRPIRELRTAAYHQGQAVYLNNFSQVKGTEYLTPGQMALDNVLFAPLMVHGKTVGLLGLANKPGGFTDNDLPLAAAFGELAAIALYNTRVLQSLKESEEKYRKLIEAANDAIILADAETGIILEVNKKGMELLGLCREEIIGKHFTQLYPEEDALFYKSAFERHVKAGGQAQEEIYLVHRSGAGIPVEVSSSVIEVGGRKVLQGIFRDLTERRRAEEERQKMEAQLRQAQKMEAIGTLAGGIAHDFNNILSAIIGFGEMIEVFYSPQDPVLKGNLEEILKAAFRAKELVQQILTFSRKGEQDRKIMQLKPLIKESLSFLRASLPTTIEIRQSLEPEAGAIWADPTQMQQVVMNLCTNAAHAMGEKGGVLEVGLRALEVEPESVESVLVLIPGPYIRLTVQDTGHGITPEILERIFDPYYTTKGAGEGTGLGLAVVDGIVKSHNGAITVTSEPEVGTTFSVFFPRYKEREIPRSTDTPSPIPGGQGRILFVDDEPAIANLVKEALTILGYEVEASTGSMAALEIFLDRPEQFDLVITDLTMPHMSGVELAQELRRLRPELPVILCTGLGDPFNQDHLSNLGFRELLRKPLGVRDLAEVIKKVLG